MYSLRNIFRSKSNSVAMSLNISQIEDSFLLKVFCCLMFFCFYIQQNFALKNPLNGTFTIFFFKKKFKKFKFFSTLSQQENALEPKNLCTQKKRSTYISAVFCLKIL